MEQHIINIRPEGDEVEEEATKSKSSNKFKQFDIIPSTDHNLIDDDPLDLSRDRKRKSKSSRKHNQSAPKTVTNLSHEATLAILKEWKILKEGLPNSIYVRAYEGRIDLLTAVIVGRPGTPFHGGLFFYKIKFPSNYPKSSPGIFYYAFADKNRPWNPTCDLDHTICRHYPIRPACLDKKLSVLEILLWIETNIVGSNPYSYMHEFIKPSYNPSTYNQDMFVFNCLSISSLIYQPPKHYEDFVVEHFRDNSESILIAYKAYFPDALTGYEAYFPDAEKTDTVATSTEVQGEFERLNMMHLVVYGGLVKDFRKIGSTSSMVKKYYPPGYIWCYVIVIFGVCFAVGIVLLILHFGRRDNPSFGP